MDLLHLLAVLVGSFLFGIVVLCMPAWMLFRACLLAAEGRIVSALGRAVLAVSIIAWLYAGRIHDELVFERYPLPEASAPDHALPHDSLSFLGPVVECDQICEALLVSGQVAAIRLGTGSDLGTARWRTVTLQADRACERESTVEVRGADWLELAALCLVVEAGSAPEPGSLVIWERIRPGESDRDELDYGGLLPWLDFLRGGTGPGGAAPIFVGHGAAREVGVWRVAADGTLREPVVELGELRVEVIAVPPFIGLDENDFPGLEWALARSGRERRSRCARSGSLHDAILRAGFALDVQFSNWRLAPPARFKERLTRGAVARGQLDDALLYRLRNVGANDPALTLLVLAAIEDGRDFDAATGLLAQIAERDDRALDAIREQLSEVEPYALRELSAERLAPLTSGIELQLRDLPDSRGRGFGDAVTLERLLHRVGRVTTADLMARIRDDEAEARRAIFVLSEEFSREPRLARALFELNGLEACRPQGRLGEACGVVVKRLMHAGHAAALPSAIARLRAAPERWGPSYTWFVPLAPAAIEALQPIASSATPAADAARRLLGDLERHLACWPGDSI